MKHTEFLQNLKYATEPKAIAIIVLVVVTLVVYIAGVNHVLRTLNSGYSRSNFAAKLLKAIFSLSSWPGFFLVLIAAFVYDGIKKK